MGFPFVRLYTRLSIGSTRWPGRPNLTLVASLLLLRLFIRSSNQVIDSRHRLETFAIHSTH